jgi:hypothetical protein
MSLTPGQAADSLKEIHQASRRSASAYSYAQASPYFILWGVVTGVGYTGSDLLPALTGGQRLAGLLWIALTVLGVIGCMVIGRIQHRSGDRVAGRAMGFKFLASFAVIYVFIACSFLVLHPVGLMASAAFAPLVTAMFYCLMGIWKGSRFLIAGIVLAVLTMAGFHLLREHFLLWMAAVSGGSLVLAGLWLRSV